MSEQEDNYIEQPESRPVPALSMSIIRKLGIITLIFGLLQIPLWLIEGVMEERQKFNVEYPLQYKGPGAGLQTLIGPVLTVPYHYKVTEQKLVPITSTVAGVATTTTTKTENVSKTVTGHLHFFPENLTVSGNLKPEIRDEGKFKNILYSTDLEFNGSFNTSSYKSKKINDEDMLWSESSIALGISDLRGIRKVTTLDWSGKKLKFVPGTNGLKLFDSGQSVVLPDLQQSGTYPFAFTVQLNGSRDMNIFPAGKENKITLQSSWKNPTFTGGFLPSQKTIDKQGFNSLWEVSYFNRNLPQMWSDADPELKNSLAQYMVGATLSTPVEFYRTAIRAVKYGNLFIILTFITFFVFEMSAKVRIHEIQYLLVGVALTIFFLLLIAISEWTPFAWAYALASIPTIMQITWYTQAFSKSRSTHLWKVMAATLSLLYVYLYILLQLENLSLLIGAIGLFIAMTVVLYSIRNIDWYAEGNAGG